MMRLLWNRRRHDNDEESYNQGHAGVSFAEAYQRGESAFKGQYKTHLHILLVI